MPVTIGSSGDVVRFNYPVSGDRLLKHQDQPFAIN